MGTEEGIAFLCACYTQLGISVTEVTRSIKETPTWHWARGLDDAGLLLVKAQGLAEVQSQFLLGRAGSLSSWKPSSLMSQGPPQSDLEACSWTSKAVPQDSPKLPLETQQWQSGQELPLPVLCLKASRKSCKEPQAFLLFPGW